MGQVDAPWGLFDLLQIAPMRRENVDFYDCVLSAVAAALRGGTDPFMARRAGGVLMRPTWLKAYIELWCADNYYKAMGVSEKATLEDITKAYKQKSLTLHPDRRAAVVDSAPPEYKEALQAQATADFQFLGHVHDTLLHKRAEYDQAKKPQRYRDTGASGGWADSGSECEEVSEVDSEAEAREFFPGGTDDDGDDGDDCDDGASDSDGERPKRKRKSKAKSNQRKKRPSKDKGKAKGKGEAKNNGEAKDKGEAKPKKEPPPPEPAVITVKLTIEELWKGTVVTRTFLQGLCDLATKEWVNLQESVTIPIPPRCPVGRLHTWSQYGEHVKESKRCRDVYVEVEDVAFDPHFSMRCGGDVVVQGHIDAFSAMLAVGWIEYRHPKNPSEVLRIRNNEQLLHGKEIALRKEGLRKAFDKDAREVGDLIVAVKVSYPPILSKRCSEALLAASAALCDVDPMVSGPMVEAILGPEDVVQDLV